LIPPREPRPDETDDPEPEGLEPPPLPRIAPHRGTAVLVLGILGLVVCFVCGIVAWAMGAGDLRAMRRGTMDRSGEGMTRAGFVLGIVGTFLNAIVVLGAIVSLMSVRVYEAFGHSNRGIAEAQLSNFADAIQRYRMDNHGKLPSSLEDLTHKTDRSPEPIMTSVPKDPWDNQYEYRQLGGKEFAVRSSGEDGIWDTDDDIVWPKR
jgi:hypothetical protein